MSKSIEVDTKTFVRFWLVIAALAMLGLFIWKAKTGLIIVGIAIFLAIALSPLADRINKIFKGKNRTLSVVLTFLGVVLAIGLIIAVIGPVVVEQTANFIKQVPTMFENTLGGWEGINTFGSQIGINNLQEEITGVLEKLSSSLLNNIGSTVVVGVGAIGSMVASTILVLVLTLLFLLEGPGILRRFWDIVEGRRRDLAVEELRRIVNRMAKVVATYVSKQFVVAVLDGVATAIAVCILSFIFDFSVGLALPMGLIAMVFCMIPMFGQIIGCVLVSLVLLFNSPLAGVIFAVFYIVYSQIENNAIAPKLQGNAMKLPAVIILVAITIGTYMFGLIGAIISIPIAGCIKVMFEEYPKIKELQMKA